MVRDTTQNEYCSTYDESMESMLYKDEYELDEFYDDINPQLSVEPLYNLAAMFVWIWVIIAIIAIVIFKGCI